MKPIEVKEEGFYYLINHKTNTWEACKIDFIHNMFVVGLYRFDLCSQEYHLCRYRITEVYEAETYSFEKILEPLRTINETK